MKNQYIGDLQCTVTTFSKKHYSDTQQINRAVVLIKSGIFTGQNKTYHNAEITCKTTVATILTPYYNY